jgi:hypothetical protein
MKPLPLVALIPFLALAGCPPCGVDTRPLPPPISKAEQLSLLNARAKLVQTLKARGGISITMTDDKGTHSYSADALIMLRQRPPAHPYDPGADVLLQGKIVGTEVFEMGVNANDHWLAFLVDPKTAFIGPMNVPPANNSANRAPLRADLVLTVLALTQFGDRSDAHLAMTSNGEAGGAHVNELHIIRFADPTGAYIQRTLVIDRPTGNIIEIRSYFPDGRAESVATLSDYKPGKNSDGSASAVQFPYKIVVEDPADRAHFELSIDSYSVNPNLPPAAFETPDFVKQGLQVQPAD